MRTLLLTTALLVGCIQYKAATQVINPAGPVVTGSAAVQVAATSPPACAEFSASAAEDAPAMRAGQILSIGGQVQQDKAFEVQDVNASDTVSPDTALDISPIP